MNWKQNNMMQVTQIWKSFLNWFRVNFNKYHLKLVWKTFLGYPYDWENLLELEKLKLEEMLYYFRNSDIVDHKQDIRNITWSIKMLDRILNSSNYLNHKLNYDNSPRFKWNKNVPDEETIAIYKVIPEDLIESKAFNIYSIIRKNYLFNWWD